MHYEVKILSIEFLSFRCLTHLGIIVIMIRDDRCTVGTLDLSREMRRISMKIVKKSLKICSDSTMMIRNVLDC